MEGGTVLRSSSTLTRPSNFAAKSTVFATQRHDFVSFRTKSSPSTNGWIKTRAAVAPAPRRLTGFRTPTGFGRGVVSASLTAASGVNNVRVSVRDGKKENPIIVIDNYDSFTYNLCQITGRFQLVGGFGAHYLTKRKENGERGLVGVRKYMGELGANFEVYRNDELTVEEMKMRNNQVLTNEDYMGELGANFEVYWNDELTVEEMKMQAFSFLKNPRGILISPGPGTPQDSGISLQTVLELGPTIPLFGVCMGLQCIGEAFGGRIVRSPYGVMHGKRSQVFYDEKGEDGLFSGLSNPFTAGRYHSLVIENDSFPNEALEITAWTEDGLVMAARHRNYKHIQGVQFHPESIITTEGKEIVRNFLKLIDRMEAGYIFVQP